MPDALQSEIDIVNELTLRRWARENYLPAGQRDSSQHPVVAHEMRLRDAEIIIESRSRESVLSFVPLAPAPVRRIHESHVLPEQIARAQQAPSRTGEVETQWLC